MEHKDHDDQAWLDALAGRMPPDDSLAAVHEARLLRQALLREAQQAASNTAIAATAASASAADADALLARARREGLLRRRWCAGCADRAQAWVDAVRRLHRPWPLAGGALALLLLAWVALPLLLPPLPEDAPGEAPILRAGPNSLVLLRDTAPTARRNHIADALMGAGAQVQRYERLGRFGLEAQWPLPTSPALAQVLAAEGLAVPAAGVLQLEVEAAP